MAYAIVETSGTQLRIEPGRFYDVNRIAAEEGDTVTLDQVLLVNDGDSVEIGRPTIEGATVTATVARHMRGKKIIVYKMQPKKKTRKKRGHRQELTRITIESIAFGSKTLTAEDSSAEPAEAAEAE